MLHTGIGLPIMVCAKCSHEMPMGLQPWSTMSLAQKITESLVILVNISILSVVFGGLFFGTFLFFIAREKDFVLPFVDRSTEGGRLIEILYYVLFGYLILAFYKCLGYLRYSSWVEKQWGECGEKFNSSLFEKHYQDW
jgi:hypothetical protein